MSKKEIASFKEVKYSMKLLDRTMGEEVSNNKARELAYTLKEGFKIDDIGNAQNFRIKNRIPLTVSTFNVSGSLNVGTIARIASNLGVNRMVTFGKDVYDPISLVNAELDLWIRLENCPIPSAPNDVFDIENLQIIQTVVYWTTFFQKKCVPVLIETGGTLISEFDWLSASKNLPPGFELCLQLGAEGEGVPMKLFDLNHVKKCFGSIENLLSNVKINSYVHENDFLLSTFQLLTENQGLNDVESFCINLLQTNAENHKIAHISIPMAFSNVASLNVSQAAAIALWEAHKAFSK